MKKLKTVVVTLVYLAVFLWSYTTIVSPAFAYDSYASVWPQPLEVAWLILLALLPVTFLPNSITRPSGLVVWWMYATVYIPSILLPAFSLTIGLAKLLPLQLALLAAIYFLHVVSRSTLLAIPRLVVGPRFFWPVLFIIWSAALIFVCSHFNVSSLIANLVSLFLGGSEYTIRNGFFDELSQAGRALGYITGQVGEALDPFLIAYGLMYRRKLFILIGVFGQLMIFAVVGSKSILFSTLFMVLVYSMIKRFRMRFGFATIGVLLCVVLLAAAIDSRSKGIYLTSITTRRTFMDPGILTGFYYEHYSQVTHAGVAYHFGTQGEAVPAPSYEIGLTYFGDEHIDANANLWAEGFADFGIPGIMLFTLLLGAMLWIYDSIAARHDPEWAALLIAMQAFALSNSPPLTVMLTHGGLASALLLWSTPTPEALDVAEEEVANLHEEEPEVSAQHQLAPV